MGAAKIVQHEVEGRMNTILSRKNDIAKCGGVTIKVPSDRSALSLFGGPNNFREGDDVKQPWIYHRDGTKSPLYTRMGKRLIREDRFYDVHKAEKTYWRLQVKRQSFLEKWQESFFQIAKKGPSFCFDDGEWIKWGVSKTCSGLSSISDEVAKENERHRNVKLGTEFSRLEKRMREIDKWRWLALEVFERATRQCCPELYESKSPGITKLTINGRAYVYQRVFTRYGYIEVSLLASPSDKDGYVELEY